MIGRRCWWMKRYDLAGLLDIITGMCGRYNLRTLPAHIAKFFALLREPTQLGMRYNIAPTQDIPVIRNGESGREMTMMRWGLVPSWEKEFTTKYTTFNAKSEVAKSKPAFRSA